MPDINVKNITAVTGRTAITKNREGNYSCVGADVGEKQGLSSEVIYFLLFPQDDGFLVQ